MTRPTAASTTDRKTPLCEVLAAAPLKLVAVADGVTKATVTEAVPEAPAAPATPGTGEAGEAAAVAPASLAAGVPAARPTLVPEVAKCIWGTASEVESSEVVVQPEAMTPLACWTWPSEIWSARPAATEQGTVTVTETGMVVDGPLLDGAEVGAGLPWAGAVVVVVWPASTGEAGAEVTVPTGDATTAGLLPAGVETGVGMSSTDLVMMAGCWGTYLAQRPW